MPYYEFTITIAEQFKERLIRKLMGSGCLGVIDQEDSFIAYFPSTADVRTIESELSLVETLLGTSGAGPGTIFTSRLIPDQDWNAAWKEGFKPIDVGTRFTILPPWEEKREGRINLVIDPAMAFGTGHHETTRSCLVLIEKYASPSPTPEPPLTLPSPAEGRGNKGAGGATSHPLSPGGREPALSPSKGPGRGGISKDRFLDLGTGSGILAIAAAHLGFLSVTAVDNDPLAVEAARKNVELNEVRNVAVLEGSVADLDGSYDFIAANLISGVLITLAPELAAKLKPGGIAVLSGILFSQADEVVEAMSKSGLKLIERYRDGKWTSLVVRK